MAAAHVIPRLCVSRISARKQSLLRCLALSLGVLVIGAEMAPPALAVVKYFDGFEDADRNNDGVVNFYDTDLNDSGTWNDPTADASLISRGITEVTAANNPNDVGIIWSGIRSFDTAANIAKSYLRIIDDSVPVGVETLANIHNSGLALGVESRGGGSSFIGRFPQSVALGPEAGDKIKVSVDFRYWREAANPNEFPLSVNGLRWGLFQDTDDELGMIAPVGNGGANVEWGKDDGNWRASQPGAEGDKGIYSLLEMGNGTFSDASHASASRINWEYNLLNINGTTNPGQIMEGGGASNTFGSGGDVGVVATPGTNGPGGFIENSGALVPHKLSMEFIRRPDGSLEVATFVDDVELLRDWIKETDTGYGFLGPPAFSYDYVAFRHNHDFDFVIDNFMLEIFGSNAEEDVPGDFDGDGDVDGRDFLIWQRGGTTPALDPGLLAEWQNAYVGQLSAINSVPEPSALLLAMLGLPCLMSRGRRRD